MRIVSLVPSWTETLLERGVNVVGRTRFCIHPEPRVSTIPVIGGTKDWQWQAVLDLKPDLLILDKEENPKFMGEQNEIPFIATHVGSIKDMPTELEALSARLENKRLAKLGDEWRMVLEKPPCKQWQPRDDLPALLEWGRKPEGEIKKIIYVIWRNPWMVVSKNTFAGSMLEHCGLTMSEYSEKYPKIKIEGDGHTLLLFSSEPYPFMKKRDGLDQLGCPYAFVNGECFTWFGVRSLRFLQSLKSSL